MGQPEAGELMIQSKVIGDRKFQAVSMASILA